ncbi:MAG: metallopeptidase TldD-related protein, partial [Halobacteriales archaeon]
MAGENEAVVEAMDTLLTYLEGEDDVAYAEVGGVIRTYTDAVITDEGVRNASEFDETGVWCRVFADGAAEYRYTTSLEDEHIRDIGERVVRAGRQLGQEFPARYDPASLHRDTHAGWATADTAIDSIGAEEKGDRIETALHKAIDGLGYKRAKVTYTDTHMINMLMTTTGTSLRTTIDRVGAESILDLEDGPKLEDHFGGTRGTTVLDRLPDHFEALADRASRIEANERIDIESADLTTVVLSPRAAGQLFHQLAHYFEIDTVYFGSSPFALGDKVGPASLQIEDTVRAGSWAACAYDTEGRPTQPMTVVDDGRLVNYFHNTASAAENDAIPHGHSIQSLALDHPPRIHARHLDVDPGTESLEQLRTDADIYIERFGTPRFRNEATQTKRESMMPPTVQYAKDIEEMTPSEFDDESDEQGIRLPIKEGFALEYGAMDGVIEDAHLEFAPDDLFSLSGLSVERETATGRCTKHNSQIPWATTAPGIRFETTLRV